MLRSIRKLYGEKLGASDVEIGQKAILDRFNIETMARRMEEFCHKCISVFSSPNGAK